jgi:hypothetical protein
MAVAMTVNAKGAKSLRRDISRLKLISSDHTRTKVAD